MKKYLVGLVLMASSCAFGQNVNQFGAPANPCVSGPKTVTDVSVTPAQQYTCAGSDGHTWVLVGGGSATVPFPVDAEWPFNDGTGTTVADISGNGHTATFASGGNAPVWGAYGVNFAFGAPSPPQTALTNITTFKSIIIAHCIYPLAQTTGTTAGSAPYVQAPTLFGSSNTTGINFGGSPSAGGAFSGAFRPNSIQLNPFTGKGSAANGFGNCHTTAFTLGTNDAFYEDGLLLPLTVTASSAALVASTGGYEFGGGGFGNVNAYRGTISYALLSINNVWTAPQVQSLNAYIQSKLALRNMPVYPTFNQVTANQLIFAGDSIWAGLGGSAVWTTLLTLNNTYTVSNWSIAGLNAYDIGRLAESRWYSQISPVAARNVVVFDGGSNDTCTGTYSAADTWSSIALEAKKALAVGAIPVASTIISRTGCDAGIAPVNVLIRANWKTAGFAALMDSAEIPAFAAGGYTNPTYYQGDGTHPKGGAVCTTADGYGLLCLNASRIVNALDGSSASNPDTTASNAFVATDANNYVIQTPTASATYQLVSCMAMTGQTKTIVNGSTGFAITVSPTSPDTIVGSVSIPAGASLTYTATVTSPTAGGCYWVAE